MAHNLELNDNHGEDLLKAKAIPVKDLIALAIVMFLWALCFPLISTGLNYAPPITFAAWRSLVAGAVLFLLGLVLRRPMPRGWPIWLQLLGVGLTSTGLGFAGMFLAGGLASPGIATVMANIQPLIAAVLAFYVLGEQLGFDRRLGLVLGFSGVLLISFSGFDEKIGVNPTATLFILLSALGVAVGNVVLKRLAGRVDAVTGMAWQFIFGSAFLFPLAALFESSSSVSWTGDFSLILFILGVLGTAIPFLWWLALLQKAELTRLNTFTFLTPVFALAIGVFYFSEPISPIIALGMGLILVGVWLSSRGSTQPSLGHQ